MREDDPKGAPVTKPNLLFIWTDEQRTDTMAGYGNTQIHTPNLNALAEQSFVFDNAYCTQPVCTPSRATILTGLYSHTHGCTNNNIPLPSETKTIAELVSDDYHCAYFGKWHLGDEVISQHGFGEWLSIEDNYRAYYSQAAYLSQSSDYHHFLVEHGFQPDLSRQGMLTFSRMAAAKLPEPYTKASFLGQRAVQFIRQQRDHPFLLHVNFLEPHMPFFGPFNEMYAPEDLPVGPTFFQEPGPDKPLLHQLKAQHFLKHGFENHDLSTEAGWRSLRARYWGLVTLVDKAVGEILRALDESGQAENTIVVFTSDHGEQMGDYCLVGKGVMYETSTKIPLLIRVPWLAQRQRRIGGRISQVDLLPTLLELMDEAIPSYLQGQSRASALPGQATLADNDVFIEWNGPNNDLPADASQVERLMAPPWRTIISAEGWKLNLSPEDSCELYDLNTDPYEQHNLFTAPAQRARIRDLAARIRVWQNRTGDTAPLPHID
jgi:arylsulfatase